MADLQYFFYFCLLYYNSITIRPHTLVVMSEQPGGIQVYAGLILQIVGTCTTLSIKYSALLQKL